MAKQILLVIISLSCGLVSGKTAFEKITEYDYQANTYYTIRNLTLWECQGWCREEPECKAASYSFVFNPLAPTQETLCLLQNDTAASDPTIKPQRAVSQYYMVKLSIRTDNVCDRPWTFERVPNRALKGLNNLHIYTSSKEECLKTCLNERVFVCRSAEYNAVSLECYLSEHDRRSTGVAVELEEKDGTDYFENLCLPAQASCVDNRDYQVLDIGIPSARINHYASLHFYVDKALMANTAAACKRACNIENEFLCRSFIYKGPPTGSAYNCQLFHLDHYALPDGPGSFLSPDRPLIDFGKRIGTYYENVCTKSQNGGSIEDSGSDGGHGSDSLVTGGGYGSGSTGGLFGGGGSYGSFPSTPTTGSNENCDSTGVCYDVSVHCKDTRIVVQVLTNRAFNGRIYALGRSETCNIDVMDSTKFRLDLTMEGQDCNTQKTGGVYTNTIVVQHHSVVMTKTDKIYKVRCTYDMTSKNITFGMLPIRDPEMIPITSAPQAPPPRIRILDAALKEVETVRIGDKLTFRIEIPKQTPYGIFARSCVAMAKDSRSTFQIIDDDGCPVEPDIFPHFTQEGTALQALYEAFRFTESYGVIFQCNVKYCLGSCKPANCRSGNEIVTSYGRRRRDLRNALTKTTKSNKTMDKKDDKYSEEEMSISQEILVLDFGDQLTPQYKKSPAQTANENYFTNETHVFEGPDVALFESCPTRSSVLALAVTCAILLLIYVLTMFYFVLRRWMHPTKRIH